MRDMTSTAPLLPAALAEIGRELTFAKAEAVFRKGDPVKAVYLVRDGEVRLSRVARDGSEVTLHRAGRGHFFAEAALNAARYQCDAVATRPTTVLAFPIDSVRKLLAVQPQFCTAWAALLARQLHSARTRLERDRLVGREDGRLYLLRPYDRNHSERSRRSLPCGRNGPARSEAL